MLLCSMLVYNIVVCFPVYYTSLYNNIEWWCILSICLCLLPLCRAGRLFNRFRPSLISVRPSNKHITNTSTTQKFFFYKMYSITENLSVWGWILHHFSPSRTVPMRRKWLHKSRWVEKWNMPPITVIKMVNSFHIRIQFFTAKFFVSSSFFCFCFGYPPFSLSNRWSVRLAVTR